MNRVLAIALIVCSFLLGLYIGNTSKPQLGQQVTQALTPKVDITFTSDPSGSILYVDGKVIGNTPQTVSLDKDKAIRYQVKAVEPYEHYDLYKIYSSELTATANNTVDIWLDRTTQEEQQTQIAAFEKKQQEAEEQRIAQEQERLKNNSKWQKYTDTNPIDDTKTVNLVNVSFDATSKWGDPIRLILRCQSNQIDAFIQWEDYLGLDNTSVTYRIGTAPAKTDTWIISTNNQSTFFARQENLNRQFVESLLNSDNGQFVAQVTPYSENPQVATFDIKGLNFFIDDLFEPCGGR